MSSYTNSDALRQELRFMIMDYEADQSKRKWTEQEVDASLNDGFGIVTYGERNEADGNRLDIALAKMYAAAQLCFGLARDKSRLKRWKSAAGEEVNSEQEAMRLESIANSLMNQVNAALKRQIDRSSNDLSTASQAEGGVLGWNTISGRHRDFNFGRVDTLNRPNDR